MKYVALLCTVVLMGASVGFPAEDTAAQEKISQLEQRVRHLQAKVTLLEAELASARAVLAERDRAMTVDANTVEAPVGADAENAAETEVRTFTSIRQLLGALPPDARPHPATGWDVSRRDKAAAWLKNHTAGTKLRARLSVEVGVGIRLPVERDGETVYERHHSLKLTTPDLTFAGQQIRPRLMGGTVRGDAEQIAAIVRVTAANSLPVSATISGVSLQSVNDAWVLTLHLADVELQHPALQ